MLKLTPRLRVEGVLLLCMFLVLPGLVNCLPTVEYPASFTAGEVKEDLSSLLSKLREEGIPPTILQPQTATRPVQLPFSGFIQNRGQLADKTIHYYYSSGGTKVSFGTSKITFVSLMPEEEPPVVFAVTFPGSHPVIPAGCKMKSHYVNYFYGNWTLTNVPTYEEIWYKELYSGIDLRYYMSDQGLKYEFIVQPGADPEQITLEVSESMHLVIEEQTVSLRPRGSSTIRFQDTTLRVFQADGTTVAAQFMVKDRHAQSYGFQLGYFDSQQALIIDPLLLNFSTLLGGSGREIGLGIAFDSANNIYVTGYTNDSVIDFPTTSGAFNETHSGAYDAFVCKLSADGSSLVYSTFLGGSNDDYGQEIAVNSANNVYITGWTENAPINFPTTSGAYNETHNGGTDVFVCKLSADGSSLLYSTFLGGSGDDYGYELAVDSANNAYVTGYTYDDTTDFPTTSGAYNETYNGVIDVFVCKFSANGSELLYSTLLGGHGGNWGYALAIDKANNVYVTGRTSAHDFPTTPGAYAENTNGHYEVFVCKFSADLSSLVYSTYLGGAGLDEAYALAVDSANNTYVTGTTESSIRMFPTTPGAYDETHNGGTYDVFVCKLSANGSELLYSTFLGGASWDRGFALAVDSVNNVYVTGGTRNATTVFPTTPDAINDTHNGDFDVFVCKLSANGSELLYSTFFGGFKREHALELVLDSENNVYITGEAFSSDFPTTPGAYDETHNGVIDVFITKFQFNFRPVITTQPTQLNATEGVWFAYDFNASSMPPGPLTWTLWGNATAWLTMNSSTGVVTGTPDYLAGDNWNVTVIVTDMNGLDAIYMVSLKVQPAVLVFAEVSPNQNPWLFDIMTLRVRVETADKQPRPDIPVDWRLDGELLGTNTTDADGFAYWTLQLTTARAYQLLAQVPGRDLSTEIYIVVKPLSFWFNGQGNETKPVWLPLGANYTIAGQLVDGEGQPVEGFELCYHLNGYSFTPLVTDANGWVNITQPFLTEGTYVLTVTKDGQELFMNGQRAELVIHVLASPTVVDQITPATNTTETVVNRPTVFVARIYFDELTPVALPGARIGLLVNGSLVDSQFSDVNGYVTFEYTFLTSGTYFVTFYYNGQSWGGVWVTVTMGYFAVCLGETTVNGTVGQPLEFTIYVQTNTPLMRGLLFYMNNGTPVIGAAIDWFINDVFQITTQTGAEGRTTFQHTFSTLGQYTIVAKHEGQVLATFVVTITEAPLWEFISENFGLLVLLLVISALLVVGSRIPVVRQKTQQAFRRFRTKLERRALSTAAFYAREFAPELEESFGRSTLEDARSDPRQKERVRRKVSTLLLRDPEVRELSRRDRLKLVDQTTEQVLARYKQKEADKS